MSPPPAVIESNTWPALFAHPRVFHRETENKTYLAYLEEILDTRYEFDSESENENLDSEGDDYSEADSEEEQAILEEADDAGANLGFGFVLESLSAVRRLRTGLGEEEECSTHPEQEDVVADFVEHSIATRFEYMGVEDPQLVAFIDDQSNTPINAVTRPTRRRGKPYRGGLTRAVFRRDLSKPRFTVASGDNPVVQGVPDVDRRFIYLPDLDALEIETLASTATLSQRGALLSLFHHHVNLSPSIGVTISSTGFRPFNFRIHLPFFALRRHETLRRDPRQRPNGSPLRDSWLMNCIPASAKDQDSDAKLRWCLYDAQRSVTLVGIEERVWTVIGVVDTFFDGEGSRNSVGYHHKCWKTGRNRRDPISGRMYLPGARQTAVDASFSDSRKYILAVLDMWMIDVSKEYDVITNRMEEVVDQGVAGQGCPAEAGGQMRDFDKWNDNVLEHLPKIINRLSQTLHSWRIFEQEDLGYFTKKSKLRYLKNIRKSVHKLKGYHKRLQKLEDLAKTNSKTIKKKIGFENHDATVNVQVLAVIAMIFSPLSQVTAMFNMQGLPFDLSVSTFGSSFVAMMCAYVTAYWLVLRWADTVKPFVGGWGNRLSPLYDVAVAKARDAFTANARASAGKAEGVSELLGSPPERPTTPVQPPPPIFGSKRTGTWPSLSKHLRRKQPEEHELSAVV